MVLTKRTSNLPLICQICGDKARGINFDVMTCMPCKAFFRRHALKSKVKLNLILKKYFFLFFFIRTSNVFLIVIVT